MPEQYQTQRFKMNSYFNKVFPPWNSKERFQEKSDNPVIKDLNKEKETTYHLLSNQ